MEKQYCIKCGSQLVQMYLNDIHVVHCENSNCELNINKKEENNWSLAEHKDNQSWAVRHIRALETQIEILESDNQALKEQLAQLQEKVEVLVQKLEGI